MLQEIHHKDTKDTKMDAKFFRLKLYA